MAAARKKRVDFALDAPDAKRVSVVGTFNGWDPAARPLKCDKRGVWRTWTSLPPGEYEYLFVVDDQWRQDPACADCVPNPYGAHNSAFRV
jgi:1,4-alpha-glucan branching enzyme